jgi:hypothetical protein
MLGFLGAIGLSLTTDKHSYTVGESPVYSLIGAVPGSQIAWTSYKNGQATGEYNANYGQTVDANGTAQLTGGAFTDADKGSWSKEVVIIAPDGSLSNAVVSFSVGAAVVTPPVSPVGSSGDFFSGNVTLPIVGTVSKPVAIGSVALLAYFLFSGKRGR